MPIRGRANRVVAIDWDARTLRIVHAFVQKRGLKVDRLLSAVIPPDCDTTSPEQMGRHIRRVLDRERIHTKHAIVDVPRDQVILKTLVLPVVRPEELPDMVQIQIAKELPFPAGEAVIDFVTSGTATEGALTADVLVAAVRRELLAKYEATIASAGLKLERVGLRPYANTVAACELLKYAMPERVLFMDVRPTLTEIDVIRDSNLVFSRAASVAIPDAAAAGGTQQDDAPHLAYVPAAEPEGPDDVGEGAVVGERGRTIIESLLVEVTRSIEAYRATDAGAQIDHMVIAGDLGVEESLAEAVHKKLGVTTELYNPAASFGWEPQEGAAASAFASTLGLVLGQADGAVVHFDFLHPKQTVSVAQQRLKKAPFVAAAVVLLLLAPVIGFERSTRDERAELARIEQLIDEHEAARKDNEKFLDFVERIRAFDEDQHVWVDVLYDVMSVLPSSDELVFTHIDMRQDEARVVLKTKAKSRDTATKVSHSLMDFRRPGRTKPRFSVRPGVQTEKKREKYTFWQDFTIKILEDDGTKKSKRRSGRR